MRAVQPVGLMDVMATRAVDEFIRATSLTGILSPLGGTYDDWNGEVSKRQTTSQRMSTCSLNCSMVLSENQDVAGEGEIWTR